MPAGKPTIASNTQAGGHAQPQSSGRVAAASRLSKVLKLKPEQNTRHLSHPVKSALVLLADEGEAILGGGFWQLPSGRRIVFQTIENMFARSLVVIVYPHRATPGHRKVTDATRAKYSVRLTEVGAVLARGVKAEWNADADNFEDADMYRTVDA